MTLVRLDTLASGVRHEACDAKRTLPTRVIDPGDIDKAVIDGCERVHYHASICILSIVDHQESRRDAIIVLSGGVGLIINGQLIMVLNKATADG